MKREPVIQALAALLILLFLYAAISKLLVYSAFTAQLHMHPMLKPFAGFLAWAIPAMELGVVLLLFIPSARSAGFTAALVLMSIFTLYIGGMLLLDSHLPCSCSGVLQNLTWEQHLIFNIFFTLAAFMGKRLEKRAHFTIWKRVHAAPP